jgi:hypothetical protein
MAGSFSSTQVRNTTMNATDWRILQALLDHREQMRQRLGHQQAPHEYCIRYADLCERAGLPRTYALACRHNLQAAAEYCAQNRWPPLNPLAVGESGVPGEGYEGAPGCKFATWDRDVLRCIQFEGYPSRVRPADSPGVASPADES